MNLRQNPHFKIGLQDSNQNEIKSYLKEKLRIAKRNFLAEANEWYQGSDYVIIVANLLNYYNSDHFVKHANELMLNESPPKAIFL